jgi:hypothetical protein
MRYIRPNYLLVNILPETQNLAMEFLQIRKESNDMAGNGSDDRSWKQREIVDRVVSSSYPMIRRTAEELLWGRFDNDSQQYTGIPIKAGNISVKMPNLPSSLEDHVQDGALQIVRDFHKYDPERSSAAFFFYLTAINGITQQSLHSCVFYRPSQIQFMRATKAAREGGTPADFFASLSGNDQSLDGKILLRNALLYLAVTGDYDPLDEATSNLCPSDGIFGIRDLSIDPEEVDTHLHRIEFLRSAWQYLSPKRRWMLSSVMGLNETDPKKLDNVGAGFPITGERVRQINAKTIELLQKEAMKYPDLWEFPPPTEE